MRLGVHCRVPASSIYLLCGPDRCALYLLYRCGAEVTSVSSVQRPDGSRQGNTALYEALHAGHEHLVLDFDDLEQRQQLAQLLASADVVIEASRPRALRQLALDRESLVINGPQIWLSITAYGRQPPADQWAGFGDDVAVSAGLLRWDDLGQPQFVGDAIADPLTGVYAALAVAESLAEGARLGLFHGWNRPPLSATDIGGGARHCLSLVGCLPVLIKNAWLNGCAVDLRVGEVIQQIAPQLTPVIFGETVLNARGGELLPGLHDHHIHVFAAAAAYGSLDCDVGSGAVGDCRDRLAQRLRGAAGSGWIRGVSYHEQQLGELDRWALDELCSDRPLRIQHRSGKLWVCNSLGLTAAAKRLEQIVGLNWMLGTFKQAALCATTN